MTEIENERMAQRNRFDEIRVITAQRLEKLFVAIKGGVKIIENLLALLLDIVARQQGRTGEIDWFHAGTAGENFPMIRLNFNDGIPVLPPQDEFNMARQPGSVMVNRARYPRLIQPMT